MNGYNNNFNQGQNNFNQGQNNYTQNKKGSGDNNTIGYLYANISKKGMQYWRGTINGEQVTIFANGFKKKETDADFIVRRTTKQSDNNGGNATYGNNGNANYNKQNNSYGQNYNTAPQQNNRYGNNFGNNGNYGQQNYGANNGNYETNYNKNTNGGEYSQGYNQYEPKPYTQQGYVPQNNAGTGFQQQNFNEGYAQPKQDNIQCANVQEFGAPEPKVVNQKIASPDNKEDNIDHEISEPLNAVLAF